MSFINLTVSGNLPARKGTTVSQPNIRDRKVSSQLHFDTMREVSETALDREITDPDWLARIKGAWDAAPTSDELARQLDAIRTDMMSYFSNKGDRTTANMLYNQWITQVCWGFPGYCREAEEGKRKKARKARR